MTQRVHTQPCHQVEIAVAGSVIQVNTFSVVHYYRIAGVDRQQVSRVSVKNVLGVVVLVKKTMFIPVHSVCAPWSSAEYPSWLTLPSHSAPESWSWS